MDLPLSSFPFALPHCDETNTAPLTALLRVLALGRNEDRVQAVPHVEQMKVSVTSSVDIRDVLRPLDRWMCLPNEGQVVYYTIK